MRTSPPNSAGQFDLLAYPAWNTGNLGMKVARHIGLRGYAPALRVVTKDQLARALHARTSESIVIWDSNLAARFERLWAQERRWRFFGKRVEMLMDDISREYGVKFGDDWSAGRHSTGEIILTLGPRPPKETRRR
jgi:hypothetical protein